MASSDVGFMFIAYNLRRIVNILTGERLKEYLRVLLSLILGFTGLTKAVFRNPEPLSEPQPAFLQFISEYRKSQLNRSVLII
jgi:hypothetical protein